MVECPPRFSVARWLVEDLPPDEMKSIGEHLDQCSNCHDIVKTMAQNKAEYESRRDEHVSRFREALLAENGREHVATATPTLMTRRFSPALYALAAAAMIGIVLTVALLTSDRNIPESAVTFKGSMVFKVVAKRGMEQFFVKGDSELKENDALRFIVTTRSAGYVSVCSVDKGGIVSPFYPDTDPKADQNPMAIEGPGRHELPGSIILDNEIGYEYLVVVFSKKRFDRRDIHTILKHKHGKLSTGLESGKDYNSSLVINTLKIRKTR